MQSNPVPDYEETLRVQGADMLRQCYAAYNRVRTSIIERDYCTFWISAFANVINEARKIVNKLPQDFHSMKHQYQMEVNKYDLAILMARRVQRGMSNFKDLPAMNTFVQYGVFGAPTAFSYLDDVNSRHAIIRENRFMADEQERKERKDREEARKKWVEHKQEIQKEKERKKRPYEKSTVPREVIQKKRDKKEERKEEEKKERICNQQQQQQSIAQVDPLDQSCIDILDEHESFEARCRAKLNQVKAASGRGSPVVGGAPLPSPPPVDSVANSGNVQNVDIVPLDQVAPVSPVVHREMWSQTDDISLNAVATASVKDLTGELERSAMITGYIKKELESRLAHYVTLIRNRGPRFIDITLDRDPSQGALNPDDLMFMVSFTNLVAQKKEIQQILNPTIKLNIPAEHIEESIADDYESLSDETLTEHEADDNYQSLISGVSTSGQIKRRRLD